MSIKSRIIEYCECIGVSQKDFALRCGLSENTLKKFTNPTCDKIIQIANAFPDLSMNWLLLGLGNPSISANLAENADRIQTLSFEQNNGKVINTGTVMGDNKSIENDVTAHLEIIKGLKERIEEYKERITELKDTIELLKSK